MKDLKSILLMQPVKVVEFETAFALTVDWPLLRMYSPTVSYMLWSTIARLPVQDMHTGFVR